MDIKKYVLIILFILKFSFLSYASSSYSHTINTINLVLSHTDSMTLVDACDAFIDITLTIEKNLLKYACPSDLESDYNSCQQSTFSLKANESLHLQNILENFSPIKNSKECFGIIRTKTGEKLIFKLKELEKKMALNNSERL